MTIFTLLNFSDGPGAAEIITWNVAVGDRVVTDQPLVTVQTDNAVVEIPSPCAGLIERLYGEPGDIIEVGAPLVAYTEGRRVDVGALVGRIPGAETGG